MYAKIDQSYNVKVSDEQMKKVREIDDSALGISRRKWGRGFAFFDEDGSKITDKPTLKRLRKLVIPPMWTDVLICRFDDGHIQAIGRDAKGRKQYIYHSVYERLKQEEKYRKMVDFSEALPKIRKKAHADLKAKTWKKKKLLALIILILDEYGIRIGNREYLKKNGTHGLTTLRRKHLALEEEEIVLTFKGKSSKDREVHIDDEELIPFIIAAAELPGYEIFRYKDSSGKFQDIDSDDVNTYIQRFMGSDFSSKDFRTWVANRLAIECYSEAIKDQKKGSRKKFSNIVIKMVAAELGNTPTVCRGYYVHPAIFNRIDEKSIPIPNPYKDSRGKYTLTSSEKLARDIIRNSYA